MTVTTEGILFAGSVNGLRDLSRALLSNTVRTPTAELFEEIQPKLPSQVDAASLQVVTESLHHETTTGRCRTLLFVTGSLHID